MATTISELEARVVALEAEVAHLKRQLTARGSEGWLKRFEGAFTDVPEFDDVVRYGQEFRRAEQPTVEELPERHAISEQDADRPAFDPNWLEQFVGSARDDEAFEEMVRLGKEWRDSQWDPDDIDYCI